jgi:tricorn protease
VVAPGAVDLPRYPAVNPEGTVVAFSWRGDIWKAPASGGGAVRLTSHPANETRSAFSPDGAQIVFESDRDGGRNLFVMNSDGTGLRQLTFGDSALTLAGTGVDAKGRVVAYLDASRENDLYRGVRPYMVPLAGGPIERVHDAFGAHPVASRDGSTILFERGGSDWARRAYQGPDNRDVWTWRSADGRFARLTDWRGNDGYAWFAGPDIVYLSDRGNGRSMNVWRRKADTPVSEGGRQLTSFDDDVRELAVSADGRTAVFVVWDTLYRLDLSDPAAQPVRVALAGAEDAQDRTRLKNFGREVTEAELSPDGKTMAFVAYGDVYVKGVEERAPFVRVTSTPWREREIAWMPDGSALLFVSDSDGGDSIYEATVAQTRAELRSAFKERVAPRKPDAKTGDEAAPAAAPVAPAAGTDPATAPAAEPGAAPAEPALAPKEPASHAAQDPAPAEPSAAPAAHATAAKPAAKKEEKRDEGARWADAVKVSVRPLVATEASERSPSPSPDGTRLAYRRGLGALVVRTLATGEERTLRDGFDSGIEWRWSPDGRWIAFEQSDPDFNSDVWIVPADGSAPAVNVSRHPDNDGSPRWSADGKVLAFLSTRVNNESDVFLVFLDKELEAMSRYELDQYFKDAGEAAKKRATERLAAARKKEAPAKADGKPDAKPDAKADAKPDAKPDGKPDAKPEPPKALDLEDAYLRLRRLTTMPGNEGNLEISPAGDRVYFTGQEQGGGLFTVAWSGGEARKLGATGSVRQISADGSKLVLVGRGTASIVNLPGGDAKPVEFTDQVEIDLAAQSRQKFQEAARVLGTIFYSATMNGVDWPAATAKWAQLAANARTDDEFDYVANRFLGELNASHLGVRSPREPAGRPGVGRLAARTVPEADGHRIAAILPESPLLRSATPLAVGDLIVAVNGQSAAGGRTLEELLRGTTGRETVLAVRRAPAGGAADAEPLALEALVVPISGGEQARLAYEDIQRRMRETVARLSNGRIGYIHVQSMDQPSLDEYERDLYAAAGGKDGLLIDVRNNGGGWTADRLLGSIMMPAHAYTVPRGGDPERTGHYPADRLFIQRYTLPINMLANEKSFSNAEITAHAFKTLKRGTLVGQQTYGGVISTGSATLIDGTTVRTPFRGWFLLDGTDMEKNGAMPDLLVPQTPEDESADRDAQLEAAVQDLMKRLR